MRIGLRRRLADLGCRALLAALPSSLQSWGWAVRCEAANIPDDGEALWFTLGSLGGLLPRALAAHLFCSITAIGGAGLGLIEGSISMQSSGAVMRSPRAVGIACAIGAVLLGLAYMAAAGAPVRYLAINAAALAIGLMLLALPGRESAVRADAAILAMAGGLLATALFGADVDGAVRWVRLGGVAIQPSLVLLPAMLVAFARARSVAATAGIAIAAGAMALQPDRAMAGMMASCLLVLAALRRDRHVAVALAASLAGFAATLAREDRLPAVPYVDQILYSAFDLHALAGVAVAGGSALLLVPAIMGWRRDDGARAAHAMFGVAWLATIVAAALGNYPTPMVGYGGSAIIGYLMSLMALPGGLRAGAGGASRGAGEVTGSGGAQMRVATA